MAKKKTAGKSIETAKITDKRKLSTGAIAMIVTAGILVLTLLTSLTVFLINAIRKDRWFDYVSSDMSKYIELSDSVYKNYELELSIAKPHYDVDVDVAILNLISSADFRKQQGDGAAYTNIAPDAGDKLVIRYRGYTLDENGEEKIISSAMSNITYTEGTTLQIGENISSLPIGFELGLLGKDPDDYAKFGKIIGSKISDHPKGDDLVIYITAERVPTEYLGTDDETRNTTKLNGTRIDLSDTEEVDKYFGKGFVETVKKYIIGDEYSMEVEIGEGEKAKKHTYKKLIIDFATSCEKAETSENGKAPLTVEGYFAYDYGIEGTATAGIRNKPVYFDVWIEQVTPFDTEINGIAVNTPDELTDEAVLYLVNKSDSVISEEELRAYEGETVVRKYRNYVKKYLDDAYDEALKTMIENELWDRLLKEAKVKKYPESKVDEIYKEYEDDVYYQYDYTGGMLQDSNEEYQSYDTVDAFAIAYLGLEEGADWKSTLYTMSKSLVKERLILFYIIQKEDMLPTEEELAKRVSALKDEYLEEYISQYLDQKESGDENFSREDLKGEEYDKFVEERKGELFDYYDDAYFEETAYYEMAIELLVKMPTVYTLDDPKPAEDK